MSRADFVLPCRRLPEPLHSLPRLAKAQSVLLGLLEPAGLGPNRAWSLFVVRAKQSHHELASRGRAVPTGLV
jgi:hypothetical protein